MHFERFLSILTFENLLILAAPLLIILYRVIKQIGVWDKLVGRDKALEGLKRLRSTAGYPVSFIYDKQQDIKVFEALFQRMRKHCEKLKIRDVLDDKFRPYLIATAGDPIEIKGLPPDWSLEERFFYPDNQPVLIVFKTPENLDGTDKQNNKGDKVCTLGELNTWLNEEKESTRFLYRSNSVWICINSPYAYSFFLQFI